MATTVMVPGFSAAFTPVSRRAPACDSAGVSPSLLGGRRPQVDAGVDGVLLDRGQLVVGDSRWSSTARLSSSWATLLAPISTEVTRWSRSTQASASWASDWPRACGDLVEPRGCAPAPRR